ncbi:MAG: hypothetical protein J6H31_12245 [Butyrivibrio sp.]|nr:hypothetical protein [Butyrivibrio sp.]
MRVKRAVLLSLTVMIVLSLSGCGEKFPELTEDEYKQTVEFAVGLLMKYSNNDKEKLTYVDAKEVQKEREKEARKAAKDEQESQTTTTQPTSTVRVEEVVPTTDSSEELPEEPDKTDDIASAIGSSETDTEVGAAATAASTAAQETDEEEKPTEVSSNAIVLSSDQTQEIESDIFLSYQGYSVSSTYPESSKSYVVNADKGKKLLVLRFDLYNASGSTKKINMINQKLLFQILLNGKNLGYSAVTFLPNDLSSYIGEIESKAHESLVILTQISEDDSTSIKSLGMIVSMNGNEQEVALK